MKAKTRKMISITVVAVLVLLCAIIFIIKTSSHNIIILSLDSLKSDNIYQLDDIEWGMSFKEVNKKLPSKLQENTSRNLSDENIAFYTSKDNYLLDGQSSSASFEFNNDALTIMQFSFHLHDDYQQWFENTDTTSLQMVLVTGNSVKPSATLTIGLR